MIALLAASAFAEAPQVDLLYDYQWARTAPVRAFAEDSLQGFPTSQPLDPRRTSLDSGLALELFFEDLYLLSLGVRGWDADYRLSGFDFEPQVWDVRVDVGAHSWFGWRGEPTVDGYLIGAAGVQGVMLRAEPWPTTLSPALHGFGGLGIANRKGRVHLRAEARLSLGLRVDAFEARAELPEQALIWRHTPGSATISLLVGMGLSPADG